MAKKTQHTNRGTCQLCARLQAISNTTGSIAAHGYTVDGGYFQGQCPGTYQFPAELSIDVARQYLAIAANHALSYDAAAAAYHAGERNPAIYKRSRWNHITTKWDITEMPFADASRGEQLEVIYRLARECEQKAASERAYVEMLEKHVFPEHGQPLKPPKVPHVTRKIVKGLVFQYAGDSWSVDMPWRGGYWSCSTGNGKSRRFSARRIRQMLTEDV